MTEASQAGGADMLQELHNELYHAQITDDLDTLFAAITKSRILLSRYRAALSAPPAVPAFFASPEQANALQDRPDDREGGVYLPLRKTAAGKFTMPLYAHPPVAAVAQPVADARKRVIAFVDEYTKRRGLDPEQIYSLGLGDDSLSLNVSDLRALAASPSCERQDVGGDRG